MTFDMTKPNFSNESIFNELLLNLLFLHIPNPYQTLVSNEQLTLNKTLNFNVFNLRNFIKEIKMN
ncbi:hypothetical protein B0A75_17720 [Flavobacterium oncorhynchi]|uniref:Uncharacterized protein n=1 Tax=Flavobacterium oncorhynchi TaxID=728056 RepID=A0A226HNK1_9FLAO|nr:hypothetical protein B0A75_17720 [Flavobacterium oncorhynchi]